MCSSYSAAAKKLQLEVVSAFISTNVSCLVSIDICLYISVHSRERVGKIRNYSSFYNSINICAYNQSEVQYDMKHERLCLGNPATLSRNESKSKCWGDKVRKVKKTLNYSEEYVQFTSRKVEQLISP